MPKVVSRSAVSSSTDAHRIINGGFARLLLYLRGVYPRYRQSLASLPRRKTDGAVVIRCQDSALGKARVFKLNATTKEPILVERPSGHERQFRFHCPRCNLPVAYQTTPPPVKSSPFLYILKGALSQAQGQVPTDAFEDEHLLE